MRVSLKDYGPTEVHDRKYFLSLDVRDPAGILLEHATDGPGMTVDEAPGDLGRTLFMPPSNTGDAEDLKAMLPQFALPGENRFPVRELPFVHRFNRPEDPDGTALVLLHGTGGSEADLMPVARRIAPRSTLLGVRGRATEEGSNRWFRRSAEATFDQDDIRAEAEAFAAFVEGAAAGYGFDPEKLVFLGYSNGANMLAAVVQLHPGLVRRAVLLRAIQVLETPPEADLTGTRVLLLQGRDDPMSRNAPALTDALVAGGAHVDVQTLSTGHELGAADITMSSRWTRQTFDMSGL